MKTINKELPKRFTEAVTKLYNAFHNDQLSYGSCSRCVVGNIVGSNAWTSVISCGNTNLNDFEFAYNLKLRHEDKKRFKLGLIEISNTGYSPEELYKIEVIFWEAIEEIEDKETQFIGLYNIIKYLCELDNIPNIIDYTSLFETNEKSEPKKQLIFND